MIVDIVMPKMGESITEGTILEWRKKVGDFVEKDELFLEIGTDKVDSEIPCLESGKIIEILADVNDVVEVGKVIARVETNGSSEDKKEANPPIDLELEPKIKVDEVQKKEPEPSLSKSKPIENQDMRTNSTKFYTRAVLKVARLNQISTSELDSINGTGRKGRVTKKDILDYADFINNSASSKPAEKNTAQFPSSSHTIEMDHMRKIISEHMKKSLDTSAHVHVVNEVNMSAIANYINEKNQSFKQKEGFSLTYTPFIIDALVKALQDFPELNSSLINTAITYHKNINIGVAVSLDGGLMVPVMFNCEEKNFLGLCRALNDIANRARAKQIAPDELSGSTFTISNFGVFDVTIGTPIINQPNVGILGVGAVKKRPVVVESENGDSIAVQSMMNLSLGFDHRLIDGSGGAKFINAIRQYIETMNLENLY